MNTNLHTTLHTKLNAKMNDMFKRTLPLIGALALMTALVLPAHAAEPQISATLEPSHVAVGEAAQLTVTTTGDSGDSPTPPHVDGLDFTPTGQSTEIQSINGVVTASTSQTYVVTATRAGNFRIPPLKIGQGTNAHSTESFVLQVTAAAPGSAAPPGANTQSAPALPAPTIPGADADQAISNNGKQAFLRLVMPSRSLHVGELVPVQIKAYFLDGMQASVNGLPSLSSDAFTLNSLDDKPAQTQEDIDGQSYDVLTWTTALTAVKAGDYSLSLDLPVQLTVRANARRRRDPSDDPFLDNSFFDDFFGNSVQKQVTLRSDADAENVRPVPSAGRPANFSGALGRFSVTAEASPDHVAAGDPITLRVAITGQGNFDRVSSDLLNSSTDWKTYKPVARFSPANSVGSEGTKTFEQAVVPLQSGHLSIPPLSLSYFDPEVEKYVTRSTTPISIEVAPVASSSLAVPAAPAPTGVVDQPTFQPNRVEAGSFTSTLRPLFLQPWYLIANLLAWLGLVAAYFFVRRHNQRARDPRFARARQADRAIQDQLAAMNSAVQHAETAEFFTAARRALQQRLGERWHLPPETITLTEINQRMNGAADDIRPVFQMADQLAYSHESLPPDDLAGWKRIVTDELKQLGDNMKFQTLIAAAIALLALGTTSRAADQQTPFNQANVEFSQKDFGRAATGYQAIVARQGFSAPVLFNLANSYAQEGKPGLAILNYERAELLAPRDADISQNLHFARSKAGLADRPVTWVNRVSHYLSLNTFSWLAGTAALLIGAGGVAQQVTKRGRFGWRVAITASVCVLFATASAVVVRWPELNEAVVTVKNTPSTSRRSPSASVIHISRRPDGRGSQ